MTGGTAHPTRRRSATVILLINIVSLFIFVEGIERRRFIDYRRTNKPLEYSDDYDDANNSDVQQLFVEQRLDHFGATPGDIPRSFRQRYFYTDRFVGDASIPLRLGSLTHRPTYAFICMGGEGPSLTKNVLVSSVHCTGDMISLASWLHKSGANVHLYALEHRYYGQSYPKFYDEEGNDESPVKNKNLIYLSSRQALADFAHFVTTIVVPASGSGSTDGSIKIVTFGGSYPGMLAAWARLKYPHLVHAAVSNSSPVQAQLDFPEYNDRVAYDLANEGVGGSDACLQIFVDGHSAISQLLQKTNEDDAAAAATRQKVADLFNVCGGGDSLSKRANVNAFLGDGVVFVPAQSNDPSCTNAICNIEHLCKSLIAANKITQSPMQALAAISKKQRNDECIDIDWEKTIQYLASDEAMEDGTRSWMWQTCTEFGFYQTCEADSSCPYGKGHHGIVMDLEICQRAFGIEVRSVWESVRQSIEQYGGWDIDASRILFTNGEVDPWSMLGVDFDHGRSSKLPTVFVQGASHHFWTHEVKENDGEAIQNAREAIYRQVVQWLDEDDALDATSRIRIGGRENNAPRADSIVK